MSEENDLLDDEEEGAVATVTPTKKTNKKTTKLAAVPEPESPVKRKRGRPPGSKISDEQKAAMQKGREDFNIVDSYLKHLSTKKPNRRGRPRTLESVQNELSSIAVKVKTASGADLLQASQRKKILEAELDRIQAPEEDPSETADELEQKFIKIAGSYGAARGIEYATWKELGVPVEVLKAAGITKV